MLSLGFNDKIAMAHRSGAGGNHETTVWPPSKGRKRLLEIRGISKVDRARLKAEHRRHSLDDAPLSDSGGDV
jgi:hypothetical protein